jgi:Flp pilus assembly protein TadB
LEGRLAKLGLRVDLARAIRAESAIQFFREPVTQPFGRPLLSWLSERRSLVSMLQERELQSYGRVDLFYLVLASFCPLAMAASVSALWSILTLAILAVLWRIWWETAFTAPGTGY